MLKVIQDMTTLIRNVVGEDKVYILLNVWDENALILVSLLFQFTFLLRRMRSFATISRHSQNVRLLQSS